MTIERNRTPHLVAALALLATASSLVACASAPPIVPSGPPTQVTFLPPDDHRAYSIRVTPLGGVPYAECVAPCQMLVPSGTTDFAVTSEGQHFASRAVVPLSPSTARIRRRRSGLGTAGGVLNALGGGLVAVSAAIYPFDMLALGIGLDVAGILLLIPGLAMSGAAGSDHVEFHGADMAREMPSSGGVSLAGAAVVPVNGGAVVTANIRF